MTVFSPPQWMSLGRHHEPLTDDVHHLNLQFGDAYNLVGLNSHLIFLLPFLGSGVSHTTKESWLILAMGNIPGTNFSSLSKPK